MFHFRTFRRGHYLKQRTADICDLQREDEAGEVVCAIQRRYYSAAMVPFAILTGVKDEEKVKLKGEV